MGLLNFSCQEPTNTPGQTTNISERECSKKFVQQGRSPFDARSVLSVREHGKRVRTPLAAFFNIPTIYSSRNPIRKEHVKFVAGRGVSVRHPHQQFSIGRKHREAIEMPLEGNLFRVRSIIIDEM